MSLASNHQNKMLRIENYLISTALKVKTQNNYVKTEKEFQIKKIFFFNFKDCCPCFPCYTINNNLIQLNLTKLNFA